MQKRISLFPVANLPNLDLSAPSYHTFLSVIVGLNRYALQNKYLLEVLCVVSRTTIFFSSLIHAYLGQYGSGWVLQYFADKMEAKSKVVIANILFDYLWRTAKLDYQRLHQKHSFITQIRGRYRSSQILSLCHPPVEFLNNYVSSFQLVLNSFHWCFSFRLLR